MGDVDEEGEVSGQEQCGSKRNGQCSSRKRNKCKQHVVKRYCVILKRHQPHRKYCYKVRKPACDNECSNDNQGCGNKKRTPSTCNMDQEDTQNESNGQEDGGDNSNEGQGQGNYDDQYNNGYNPGQMMSGSSQEGENGQGGNGNQNADSEGTPMQYGSEMPEETPSVDQSTGSAAKPADASAPAQGGVSQDTPPAADNNSPQPEEQSNQTPEVPAETQETPAEDQSAQQPQEQVEAEPEQPADATGQEAAGGNEGGNPPAGGQ